MTCHGAPVLHLHQTRLDQVFVRLYLSRLSLQITGAIMSDDEMEQPGFLIRTDPKKANKADHLAGQPATEPASSNSVENEEGATSVQPSETDDLVAHPYANLFPMMRGTPPAPRPPAPGQPSACHSARVPGNRQNMTIVRNPAAQKCGQGNGSVLVLWYCRHNFASNV